MKYPCFCKVWDGNDICVKRDVYFTLIVEKHHRYIDHNGNFWDNAVPLTEAELNDPIKTLVGYKNYKHLTEQPEELEHNVALDLLHGCQNCGD